MDMKQLQTEHKTWLDSMFPHQDKSFPAAGIVEESAELLHAMLKHASRNVWGEEQRYRDVDWRAEMVDAVGDCAIYVCSYCNTVGWDFSTLCTAPPAHGVEVPLDRGSELVGLAAAFVKNQTWEQAYIYMSALKGIATALHFDFTDAVESTWLKVKERKRG